MGAWETHSTSSCTRREKSPNHNPSMICFHLAHFRVLLASLAGMKHHLECHIQPNWMGQAWTEGAPVPPALTALTRDKNRPDHILENLLTFMVNNLNCL